MIIAANDLKVKGVSLFDQLLSSLDEVLISVRGKNKYVVVGMERYEKLREYELEHAVREVRGEIDAGEVTRMSAQEHIEAVRRELDD
jgi:PHD/YefM family antitoxin component YafN of YafNO toxin-antitoxin module